MTIEASAKAMTIFRLTKRESTLQNGYRKCGTHARVFSQTLAHGNSKNDTDIETEEEGKKRRLNMERSTAIRKKDVPTPNCSLGPLSSGVATP